VDPALLIPLELTPFSNEAGVSPVTLLRYKPSPPTPSAPPRMGDKKRKKLYADGKNAGKSLTEIVLTWEAIHCWDVELGLWKPTEGGASRV